MGTERQSGLEGVVAASTSLSRVDGEAGQLILAGYAVEEIAPRARVEEMVHLLWYGRLPDKRELKELTSDLSSRRGLPVPTLSLVREAAKNSVPAMDVLRMAVATLRLGRPESPDEDARTLVASFPTIVGALWRLRNAQEPLQPRTDLSHVEYCLYQTFGGEVGKQRARGLETYLNTVCDHGLNASTFAARVIVSTHSDLISAVTGAIGALKGPLHGGAPGPALDMVFEIGTPERAETVIAARLDRGERLMGFGHRVYRVRDPRADVLGPAAERLYASGVGAGDERLYRLARQVEATALRLL